jgi:hypothetical protein
MKIRTFSPGDHVAKLDWNNRPLHLGIVTDVRPGAGVAQILSPNGCTWEYIHDITPADDIPHGNK